MNLIGNYQSPAIISNPGLSSEKVCVPTSGLTCNVVIPQVKEEEDLHEQDMEKLRAAYQQMLAQVWNSVQYNYYM